MRAASKCFRNFGSHRFRWLSWVLPGVLLIAGSVVLRAAIELKVDIQPEVRFVQEAAKSDESGKFYQVESGASLTLTGSNSKVRLRRGSILNLRGTKNVIYMEAGSSASIVGEANMVWIMEAGDKLSVDRATNRIQFVKSFLWRGEVEVPAQPKPEETTPPSASSSVEVKRAVMPEIAPPAPVTPTTASAPPTVVTTAPASAPPAPVVVASTSPSPPIGAPSSAAPSSSSSPPPSVGAPPVAAPAPAAAPAPVPAPRPSSSANALAGLMMAGDGLVELLKMFPGQANATGFAAPANVPQDTREPLCGAWLIAAAATEGIGGNLQPGITGNIWFSKEGTGWIDAVINFAGQKLLRKGTFKWSATGKHLTISPENGVSSKWERVENTAETQTARLQGKNDITVKLGLRRAP